MNSRQKQQGFVLIIALIMMVLLTLFALSAINSSNSNLYVANNMQMQAEAQAAAQQSIEQIISTNFTALPASSVISVDINNDGTSDYSVTIPTPTCLNTASLTNSTPNLPSQCLSSSTVNNSGIVNASGVSVSTPQSWCSAQLWEVQGSATSTSGTAATATIHQGVTLNVPVGTNC